MKELLILTIFVMMVVPCVAIGESGTNSLMREGGHLYPGLGCYWYPCPPQFVQPSGNEVRKVLEVISHPERRNKAAEEWFQFSKQSTIKTLEIQTEWVQLQERHLSSQREIEQLRLEKLKLQVEIEKLQVEKLRLERENLELRLKLQKETGKQEKTK
jgi:hypothetical protein